MTMGWRVVTGAFVGMVLANGFFTYAFTILVNPIREEFSASLEQVMYSLTLGTLGGLIVSPIIGVMIDRYSVRHIMTVGGLITFAGLYWMAATQSIASFNIAFGVTMCLSMGTMSSMTGSAVVSRWFTSNRGKALGIAAMGTSVGGVIVPALLTWWVESEGWRGALQNTAWVTLIVVTPYMWVTIRNRPEAVEPLSQGNDQSPAPPGPATADSLTMAEIIRMREFWLIGLSMGFVFAAFATMLANLSPYAARLGVSDAAISTMIAVLSVAGLVGKLIFGTAADKINLKYGLWSAHCLLLIAFALLLLEPPYWVMLIAAICFGLATGGLLPVWNALVAKVFGVNSFGRAMGAMGPLITLNIMPAYAIVGRLFDSTGSYSAGLIVFGCVLIGAAAMLIPLRVKD